MQGSLGWEEDQRSHKITARLGGGHYLAVGLVETGQYVDSRLTELGTAGFLHTVKADRQPGLATGGIVLVQDALLYRFVQGTKG